MLIEMHMIQNHSPSNLNRDDLGAPKTCTFGGVMRARISSQCIKRSIRNPGNPHDVHNRGAGIFFQALGDHIGLRTKAFPELIGHALKNSSIPEGEHERIVKAFRKIAEAEVPGERDDDVVVDEERKLAQLVFLERSEADAFVAQISKMRNDEQWGPSYSKWISGELSKKSALTAFLRKLSHAYTRRSVDIALFGRMTTSEAFEDVEAAMQVAHAISTHEVTTEVDYFTAVDDLGESGGGAGHVSEAMFDSACFYKYFCLDWSQLLNNLGETGQRDPVIMELAAGTLGHFLRAAALSTPSGRQNSFAAHNLPDGILVELKREEAVPVSYANAFAVPVPRVSQRGLVGQSVAQLGQYVHDIAEGYGIPSERFWFSPADRFPLTWTDPTINTADGVRDVLEPTCTLSVLDDLVQVVVERASGLEWTAVKDLHEMRAQRRG